MHRLLPVCTLFIAIILIAAACESGTPETRSKPATDTAVRFRTSLDWEERFSGIDSFVVVFYDDPYMKDSLRYTRYYKQVSLNAEADRQVIGQQLGAIVHQSDFRKGCRSEGKIWCFAKGSIRQTLYFNTGAQNCTYVYFIKDGNFFYSMPSTALKQWLETNKPKAIKPEGSEQ